MNERERMMAGFLFLVGVVVWRNEVKRREYVDGRLGSDKERLDAHDIRAALRRGIIQGVGAVAATVAVLATAYAALKPVIH